jgi:hypothetical protein
MNQLGLSRRERREEKYSDDTRNYYYDRYKRLFYLANDFGLDYQPRVMVFLEGKTEEIILPKILAWYLGNDPKNMGIDLFNIEGISKFFGGVIPVKNSLGKIEKKFLSNFNHLISYNLEKWQIIPFFIGDNENSIISLLKNKISIDFKKKSYSFPVDWQFIWGITNNNIPFIGKDFEMANFNNDEIADAIGFVLKKRILPDAVQVIRSNEKGIKQIDIEVSNHKIPIVNKLIMNLFDQYREENKKEIYERPIFKVIEKIRKLALLNHPPVNRKNELKNIEYFEGILKKMEESMTICPYYKTEIKNYPDREKRLTIGQTPPIQFPIIWCNHENSAQRKDEKGELSCNGEIGKDNRCPLIINRQ